MKNNDSKNETPSGKIKPGLMPCSINVGATDIAARRAFRRHPMAWGSRRIAHLSWRGDLPGRHVADLRWAGSHAGAPSCPMSFRDRHQDRTTTALTMSGGLSQRVRNVRTPFLGKC